MKTTTALYVALTSFVAIVAAGPVSADGGMSADKARAVCEKRGVAGDAKKLRECCDNLISPQIDTKTEKRMIDACVAGTTATKPAAKGSSNPPPKS
jgi:hypothetical protein